MNDFSAVPAAPDTSPYNTTVCASPFLWQDLDTNTEVIAVWCNGYSWRPWGVTPCMEVMLDGFNEALVVLMRVDNTGPQTFDEVIEGTFNFCI